MFLAVQLACLLLICGCEEKKSNELDWGWRLPLSAKPPAKPAKGTLGATDIPELLRRYKEAHQAKDIEAMRAIHDFYVAPWEDTDSIFGSMGPDEGLIPKLFEFDLEEVELVTLDFGSKNPRLDYIRRFVPTPENNFSLLGNNSVMLNHPYKILLHGRRPQEANGPLVELDTAFGISEREGRYYFFSMSVVLQCATNWVQTGQSPDCYRPVDHRDVGKEESRAMRRRIEHLKKWETPPGWESIVQPPVPDLLEKR
ncbi:hypothetical protein [Symmachiella macrocystis]|nr:hypothetical protein [Symmachiella macrocystis]